MTSLILISAIILGAEQLLTEGNVELIADGFLFTEGPVWLDATSTLLFSDIPADTIYTQDKTVFRKPSGESNGLTLDTDGLLIACEHKNRRVTRTEKDGAVTVLAEKYEGKRFNSPNDAVVRSDGIIFFTDPPYGLPGGLEGPNADMDFSGVYRIGKDSEITLLKNDFIKPNGLTLSPDENILYVADTEGKHIRAFDLTKQGTLENDRVFCELPSPDGIKMDTQGNVWATASDGVRVYSPEGNLLQTVVCPQGPANCAFGESDSRTLFITARTGLYKVRTNVEGTRPTSKE